MSDSDRSPTAHFPPPAAVGPGNARSRMTGGVLFGIAAAVAFGTNPLFAKPLFECNFDVDTVLTVRFLPATILMGFLTCLRGARLKATRGELAVSAVAGLLFCVTSQTLFLSYRDIDVGVAATLLFVYPVIVALAPKTRADQPGLLYGGVW